MPVPDTRPDLAADIAARHEEAESEVQHYAASLERKRGANTIVVWLILAAIAAVAIIAIVGGMSDGRSETTGPCAELNEANTDYCVERFREQRWAERADNPYIVRPDNR